MSSTVYLVEAKSTAIFLSRRAILLMVLFHKEQKFDVQLHRRENFRSLRSNWRKTLWRWPRQIIKNRANNIWFRFRCLHLD